MSYPRSWSGFGGGRVSLRVAISNRRLIAFDETGVTFRYKNYRRDGPERQRVMTFAPHESIRRFLPHVLPHGFHRVHHYGLFASSNREANVARARELLAVAPSRCQKYPIGCRPHAPAPTRRHPAQLALTSRRNTPLQRMPPGAAFVNISATEPNFSRGQLPIHGPPGEKSHSLRRRQTRRRAGFAITSTD
jgi:hypothetical protein